MSHFTVTVAVKAEGASSMEDALEAALEPFDENGECFREGSRWDWWQIGGRWEGQLRTKDGEVVDAARKSEIDWDAVGAGVVEGLRENYAYYSSDDGAQWADRAGDYAVRPGEDEDSYVRRRFEPFHTHAFLGLDGEWHENGRMGWFGSTVSGPEGDEHEAWPSEYQRLLAAVPDDAFLVIVDCHV